MKKHELDKRKPKKKQQILKYRDNWTTSEMHDIQNIIEKTKTCNSSYQNQLISTNIQNPNFKNIKMTWNI